MCGKIPTLVFEYFLLRLEFGDVAACILEGVKYTRSESKLRDGVVRVGSQDARDIFVPLIISDPTADA